jgi:hypothetical protein
MRYNVNLHQVKKFCYDVFTFNIKKDVLQKNIKRYSANPLKEFNLNTIYMMNFQIKNEDIWYYFVIYPASIVGTTVKTYRVGLLPLRYHTDKSNLFNPLSFHQPLPTSKEVQFLRENITLFRSCQIISELNYDSVVSSILLSNQGRIGSLRESPIILFPLPTSGSNLFLNWDQDPFEVKS